MIPRCLFCGGVVAEDGACDLCGTTRLAVDEKRIAAPCPRCGDVQLGPVAIGAVVLQGCAQCGGLFVAATEWDAILELTAHAPVPDPIPLRATRAPVTTVDESQNAHPYRGTVSMAHERESAPPPAVDLERAVACPVCRNPAERLEFGGISGVFVDVCSLHGIWLDAGELAKVVKVVRENPAFLDANWRLSAHEARLEGLLRAEGAELAARAAGPREPSLATRVLRALVRRFRRH